MSLPTPEPLIGLAKAHAFVERLKRSPSWPQAERELQNESAAELRDVVMVLLAREKRRQLGGTKHQPSEDYLRWSRSEPL